MLTNDSLDLKVSLCAEKSVTSLRIVVYSDMNFLLLIMSRDKQNKLTIAGLNENN